MPPGSDRPPKNPDTGSSDRPVSRMERRRARSRRHRRRLIGAVCVLGLACAAGAVVKIRTPDPVRRASLQSPRKGGKKPTSTTTSTITAATQHVAVGSGDLFDVPPVAAYLTGTTEDVTAAVYDDVTGVTSVYRPGVAQDTASIMKVDILATLLAQGQSTGQALTPGEQSIAVPMISGEKLSWS